MLDTVPIFRYACLMLICGQDFSAPLLERIMHCASEEPNLSRRALSRRVCEWLDWRAPNGQLKDMSCRVALGKLEERGLLELPRRECGLVGRSSRSAGQRSLSRLRPLGAH